MAEHIYLITHTSRLITPTSYLVTHFSFGHTHFSFNHAHFSFGHTHFSFGHTHLYDTPTPELTRPPSPTVDTNRTAGGLPYPLWQYFFFVGTDLGWVCGSAGLTGVLLLLILIVMVLCSLPCVRRRGHFEVSHFDIMRVPLARVNACDDAGVLLDAHDVLHLVRPADPPCH